MTYLELIRSGSVEPERLEVAFHEAAATGQSAEFASAIEAEYAAEPDNVLWAVWHYRLAHALTGPGEGRAIAWRDVLIVYSAMLFAVVALLAGVTPAPSQTLTPAVARWLRWGMLAVAALALLVGLYALAAIGYRTWEGGWTPNRLTFIGWNVINLVILAGALAGLVRGDDKGWPQAMRRMLSLGMVAYAVWVLLVIVGVPVVF